MVCDSYACESMSDSTFDFEMYLRFAVNSTLFAHETQAKTGKTVLRKFRPRRLHVWPSLYMLQRMPFMVGEIRVFFWLPVKEAAR